jgi:hypothetical protein
MQPRITTSLIAIHNVVSPYISPKLTRMCASCHCPCTVGLFIRFPFRCVFF